MTLAIRSAARMCLLLLLVGSLALSVWTLNGIARNPLLRPFTDRTAAEIAAVTDRLLASNEAPALIVTRLNSLLAEPEPNWIAIDAVQAVATDQQVTLPPELAARLQISRDQAGNWLTVAGSCAACAYDAASCTLTEVAACQVPILLTPLPDLFGLVRAGTAYGTGGDVDQVDLILSVVGLSSLALVVVSGGSSASLKLGASAARLGRRMGLLSPRLTELALTAARNGVDWAGLSAVRGLDDLSAVLRPQVLRPVAGIAADIGQISAKVGPTQALHLLRYIDTAPDARRLANATKALGAKTIGRIEVLGKSRLLRATLRYSDSLWALISGITGLILGLAGLAGSLMQPVAMRGLRRAARMM